MSFLRAFAHAAPAPWNVLPTPLHLIVTPHSLVQLHFLREAFLTPQMNLGSPDPYSHDTFHVRVLALITVYN